MDDGEKSYSRNKAELLRGAKAGAISGIIYGPINWLSINIGINLSYGTLGNWIARTITQGTWALTCIIKNIIGGVIGGMIFGVIFAVLYDKLPGKTSGIKIIIISIIYWVAIPLGLPVLNTLRLWGFEGFFWGFMWEPTLIGLVTSIIWGWLLGFFWDRFGS